MIADGRKYREHRKLKYGKNDLYNFIAKMALCYPVASGPACISLKTTFHYYSFVQRTYSAAGVFLTAACVTDSMVVSIIVITISLILSMIISSIAVFFVAFIVLTVSQRGTSSGFTQ